MSKLGSGITAVKIPSKTLKTFYKRFAYGEQYLIIDLLGQIIEQPKTFYWQEREVYNKIMSYIELLKCKGVSDDKLYGRYGFVSRVYSLQVAYNKIKNNAMMIMNRYTCPSLCVEDGSIDIDDLDEEGLAPGKIVVYRSGSQKPTPSVTLDTSSDIISSMAEYEEHIEDEMFKIYTRFLEEWRENEANNKK